MGPSLSATRGDKFYSQYRPLCEECPRDRDKVVGTLQGVVQMGNKNISYITNDRVYKSDEIAEEKKYLRGIWIFSEIDQYERKRICKPPPISSDFVSSHLGRRFGTSKMHLSPPVA